MLSNEYDLYIGDGLHTLMFVTKNVLNEFAFRETYYHGEERHIKIKTVDALSYASEDEYQVYSYMEYDDNLKDNINYINLYNHLELEYQLTQLLN